MATISRYSRYHQTLIMATTTKALLLILITLGLAAAGNVNRTSKKSAAAAASTGPRHAGPEDLIGGLIDHFTCSRTTNRGYKGRCVPRACCTRSFGVNELCTDIEYTCCYGGDRCTSGAGGDAIRDVINEFDELNRDRYPYPDEDYDFETRGGRCGRNEVRRREWNAEPTRERVRPMTRRLEHVIVHHTGDGERACWTFDECRRYLRYTQRTFQLRKGFPDIPWNFLISENGEVFEGMGWGVEGYHTENWNDRSLGIAFIGDYDVQTPTRRAMQAFVQLLECGVRQGHLDSYYGIYGHNDLRTTECPGEFLYEAIRHMKAFRQYLGKKIFGNFIENRSAGNGRNSSLLSA